MINNWINSSQNIIFSKNITDKNKPQIKIKSRVQLSDKNIETIFFIIWFQQLHLLELFFIYIYYSYSLLIYYLIVGIQMEQYIADRMLQDLEDQYNEVHNPKYNLDLAISKQQQQQKAQQPADQHIEQGYETLNGGDVGLLSDSDQQKQQNPQNKQPQLIQVGPVPESMFDIPDPRPLQINSEKIKSFALQMDIKTPEWMNNPKQFQQRIKQLFQNQKHKFNTNFQRV